MRVFQRHFLPQGKPLLAIHTKLDVLCHTTWFCTSKAFKNTATYAKSPTMVVDWTNCWKWASTKHVSTMLCWIRFACTGVAWSKYGRNGIINMWFFGCWCVFETCRITWLLCASFWIGDWGLGRIWLNCSNSKNSGHVLFKHTVGWQSHPVYCMHWLVYAIKFDCVVVFHQCASSGCLVVVMLGVWAMYPNHTWTQPHTQVRAHMSMCVFHIVQWTKSNNFDCACCQTCSSRYFVMENIHFEWFQCGTTPHC